MFFLVPIVVSIMILKEAFQYANKLLSATAATVLSIAAVVPVCFLAGLLASSIVGQRLVRGLEDSVPSTVPACLSRRELRQQRVRRRRFWLACVRIYAGLEHPAAKRGRRFSPRAGAVILGTVADADCFVFWR